MDRGIKTSGSQQPGTNYREGELRNKTPQESTKIGCSTPGLLEKSLWGKPDVDHNKDPIYKTKEVQRSQIETRNSRHQNYIVSVCWKRHSVLKEPNSKEGPGTLALISALNLEKIVGWLFALVQTLYCKRVPAKAKSIQRENSGVGLPAVYYSWGLW